MNIPEVVGVHSVHLWSLTADKTIFSAHIEISNENIKSGSRIIKNCQTQLQEKFKFYDITLQPEMVAG